MPLLEVILLAGIQGLAEALCVSRSGHDAVAWIWLDEGPRAAALEALLHLGTGLGLLLFAKQQLVAIVGEGVRAIARPSLLRTSPAARDAAVLLLAVTTSLVVRVLLAPFVELWRAAPLAVGVGMVFSGMLLVSTALVSPGETESLPLGGALLLGLVHGLAVLPGASEVGFALVMLAWMGIVRERALTLACLLSSLTLFASFGAGLAATEGALDPGALGLGLLTAYLGATVGAGILRALLVRRSLAWLALWVVPLGLSTIGYARLLPGAEAPREAASVATRTL